MGAAAGIVAAVAGAALGTYEMYEQKRAGDRQEALMKEQTENAKRVAQDEEQARNKANQKTPDISGLLESNTTNGLGDTNLTGAQGSALDPSRLGKGNKLLGG